MPCATTSSKAHEAAQHAGKSTEQPAEYFFRHVDLKWMKHNVEHLEASIRDRKIQGADVRKVVALHDQMSRLQFEMQQMRALRNRQANQLKQLKKHAAAASSSGEGQEEDEKKKGFSSSPATEEEVLVAQGKDLREQLHAAEKRLKELEVELHREAKKVPNLCHPDTPRGSEEHARLVCYGTVEKPAFPGFEPEDHVALSQRLDLVNFEAGSRVAGNNFVFLRNEAVLMELALVQWTLSKAAARGFTPVITPDVVRPVTAEGCGFQPRGEGTQTYSIEGNDLCLVATSELALAGYYQMCSLPIESLPVRMVAFSHCFRAEAGGTGLRDRGLYRLHQFSKVELFALTTPEQSDNMLEDIVKLQQEIFSELGLHYRVLDMPTEELGAPAYRKYDIEAWMPGRGSYGEVSSASNCTDYQSRRLNICYNKEDAGGRQRGFVHTVNGTGCAVPRTILAILENHQTAEGTVKIPPPLVPFMHGIDTIGPKPNPAPPPHVQHNVGHFYFQNT